MVVNLYSTNCPNCLVLEKKLHQKSIDFNKITEFDVKPFVSKGFLGAPILEVDGTLYKYVEAVKWINSQGA